MAFLQTFNILNQKLQPPEALPLLFPAAVLQTGLGPVFNSLFQTFRVIIMRHNASSARDYDKKFDFASPDARGGASRTASHRYLPADGKGGSGGDRSHGRSAEDFSATDFKPRWWPAPDLWR